MTSDIERSVVELQAIMTRIDMVVDKLAGIDITSNNYQEASDAASLLEILEASIREKRQLIGLKLGEHYMNKYLERHRRKASLQLSRANP